MRLLFSIRAYDEENHHGESHRKALESRREEIGCQEVSRQEVDSQEVIRKEIHHIEVDREEVKR